MTDSFVVFWLVLVIIGVSSIRIIKEHQRAAMFRLGQFVGVRGPGLIWVIPIVDKAEIIDLNKWVPGWQGLATQELDERVKSVALSRPHRDR